MNLTLTIDQSPLSMNGVYRRSPWSNAVYMTREGKDYKQYCKLLAQQAMGNLPISRGKIAVEVICAFPDMRGDLDNCSKLLLDSFQGVVYVNDRQIWQLSLRREVNRSKPHIDVKITEIEAYVEKRGRRKKSIINNS